MSDEYGYLTVVVVHHQAGNFFERLQVITILLGTNSECIYSLHWSVRSGSPVLLHGTRTLYTCRACVLPDCCYFYQLRSSTVLQIKSSCCRAVLPCCLRMECNGLILPVANALKLCGPKRWRCGGCCGGWTTAEQSPVEGTADGNGLIANGRNINCNSALYCHRW